MSLHLVPCAFFNSRRQQRMRELSTVANASVFNQVFAIQKPDYGKDVTEASSKAFVLVHMTSSLGTNVESRVVTEIWRQLAPKLGEIKFCEIRADLCVEGYPEQNTPTILVYKDGDIKRQLITLKELSGVRTTAQGTDIQSGHRRRPYLNSDRHRKIACRPRSFERE